MNVMRQQTIKRSLSLTGVGLHSGRPVRISMKPVPANHGIVFVRTDVAGSPEIPAQYDRVVDTKLCTCIGADGATVGTVEHLMAALYAMGLDNLRIELDGPEVPIFDGSSQIWIEHLQQVGVKRLVEGRGAVVVRRTVEARNGDAFARLEPSSRFRVTASIDFDHPLISSQTFTFDFGRAGFINEIAAARTFAFKREVDALRSIGLAQGGSLCNAIVVDDFSILNPEGLRFSDEFVRHKVLDAIGDLALSGERLVGHLILNRSGHALNNQLLHALFEDARNFRRVGAGAGEIRDATPFELPILVPSRS